MNIYTTSLILQVHVYNDSLYKVIPTWYNYILLSQAHNPTTNSFPNTSVRMTMHTPTL